MNRENIYFSHDANAMNDPKCMLLIDQLGMEGYGIFWGLVENLRQQPEYKMPLVLIPALATRFKSSESKVKTVISAYGLFVVENDEFFYSQSLRDRMTLMQKKIESRKNAAIIAGRKSGESRRRKTLALAEMNERSTNVQQTLNENEQKEIELSNTNVLSNSYSSNTNCSYNDKDSCIKEKKEGNSSPKGSSRSKAAAFSPPSIYEVSEYCKERQNGIDPEQFCDFYQSKGWIVGKAKMKDWKAAVRNWEKRMKNEKGQQTNKQYEEL